jgi:hypothetical protein
MSNDAPAPWLDALRRQLGARAETVNQAVKEVSEVAGPSSAAWPDLRRDPELTVYILSDGVLLILRGERDSEPDQRNLDDEIESRCECRLLPITASSRWSLSVIRTAPTVGEARVTRRWTFEIGDPVETLKIEYSPSDRRTASTPDPTPLARALMRLIARASGWSSSLAKHGSA